MKPFDYRTSSWLAYTRACAFLSVASELERQEDFKLVPTVVNAAFSCELYLKAHLIMQNRTSGPIKAHKLRDLFQMLDEESQKIVKSKADIFDWDHFLDEADNAFVEWRYIHEEEKLMYISISGLIRFAEALKSRYENKYIPKEVPDDKQ